MSLFHNLLAEGGVLQLTVSISGNHTVPLSETSFLMTVVFSREVVSFDASMISGSNVTFGAIFTSDNITWLVEVLPEFDGDISIQIPAGGVTGTAGGTNSASNTISITVAADYTTNMLDQWFANRNSTLNVAGTKVETWKGIDNNTLALGQGTIFPSGGNYSNMSDTNYFNLGQTVALGWAGNISLFMRIKAATTLVNNTEVLWNSTGGDDFRIYAKVSAGAPRVGVRIISTITTHASLQWPQDGLEHYVGIVVDFPAGTAKFFFDGALSGTISFTAATGIDYTTTTGSPSFLRLGAGVFFSQAFDKFRVYKEAVSNANAQIITNASNLFATFSILEDKQTLIFFFCGESIMRGHNATAGDMPPELQQQFDTILGWKDVTDGFLPMLAGVQPDTQCGPQLEALYQLQLKYPNFNIRYFFSASAGSTLALTPSAGNSWNTGGSGALYNNFLATVLNGLKLLFDVELRDVPADGMRMAVAQGINDCDNSTRAADYASNLSAFLTAARAAFTDGGVNLTDIAWVGPHTGLPVAGGYTVANVNTVRAAITSTMVGSDDFSLLITIPDPLYPLEADDIHFDPDGTVHLGDWFASVL